MEELYYDMPPHTFTLPFRVLAEVTAKNLPDARLHLVIVEEFLVYERNLKRIQLIQNFIDDLTCDQADLIARLYEMIQKLKQKNAYFVKMNQITVYKQKGSRIVCEWRCVGTTMLSEGLAVCIRRVNAQIKRIAKQFEIDYPTESLILQANFASMEDTLSKSRVN